MLSLEHEFLVGLFRDNVELAPALLRACTGIAVEHARVAQGSIDLSQVAPTGYHADAVAVLRDDRDRAVTGVIVEVQRQIDGDKLLSWPLYVAALRAQLACAAVLLVLAPTEDVVAWARRPIELGHPGFRLTPIVIGFEDVPRIVDRSAASHLPELATLSAVAHRELDIAEAAIDAIGSLPDRRARLYLDAIINALPPEAQRTLEARMIKGYEYQSDFARRYFGEGREQGLEQGRQEGLQEGRQEGLQEGRQEGLQEGRQEGLRAAVVALARTRLDHVPDEDIVAIARLSDPRALTELVTLLGEARTAAEVRVALDRALRR